MYLLRYILVPKIKSAR